MKRSTPRVAAAEYEWAHKPGVPLEEVVSPCADSLGLSTGEAKRNLLGQLDAGRAQIVIPPHFNRQSTLVRAVLGVTVATAAALAANGAYLIACGEPVQT
ncbi:hypothetical protein H4R19_003700, partial [Coemansia spiralis]